MLPPRARPLTDARVQTLSWAQSPRSRALVLLLTLGALLGSLVAWRLLPDRAPGGVAWLTTLALWGLAFGGLAFWGGAVTALLLERGRRHGLGALTLGHEGEHDALTGLPGRVWLRERLGDHARRGVPFGLLLLDLDDFRGVNDTLGQGGGDALLVQLAVRLAGALPPGAELARVSGDEFAVLAPGSEKAALGLARELAQALRTPFEVEQGGADGALFPAFTSASVGVSLYPRHAGRAEDLLRQADQALAHAKAQGRGQVQLYCEDIPRQARARRALEQSLRGALSRGELELHYQPMYKLHREGHGERHGGRLAGAEALVRWRRPDGRLVPPDDFIPLAEETGLILELGSWALREACRQNRAWQQAGFAPLVVAVNVSARQFEQSGFVSLVEAALRESGLDPRWLELELTESSALSPGGAGRIAELRSRGLRVSLDDFGTGYSSLSQLQQLAISSLKIDRSFVHALDEPVLGESGGSTPAIVHMIIAMAHTLGLRVVAEGIETPGQLALLRAVGCAEAQGFLFARPQLPAELTRLMRPGSLQA